MCAGERAYRGVWVGVAAELIVHSGVDGAEVCGSVAVGGAGFLALGEVQVWMGAEGLAFSMAALQPPLSRSWEGGGVRGAEGGARESR